MPLSSSQAWQIGQGFGSSTFAGYDPGYYSNFTNWCLLGCQYVGCGAQSCVQSVRRHPELKLKMPAYLVVCMSWRPDFEFRGTHTQVLGSHSLAELDTAAAGEGASQHVTLACGVLFPTPSDRLGVPSEDDRTAIRPPSDCIGLVLPLVLPLVLLKCFLLFLFFFLLVFLLYFLLFKFVLLFKFFDPWTVLQKTFSQFSILLRVLLNLVRLTAHHVFLSLLFALRQPVATSQLQPAASGLLRQRQREDLPELHRQLQTGLQP